MGPMLGTSGTWDVRDVDVGRGDVGRQGRGRGTWDVDGLTRPAVYNA